MCSDSTAQDEFNQGQNILRLGNNSGTALCAAIPFKVALTSTTHMTAVTKRAPSAIHHRLIGNCMTPAPAALIAAMNRVSCLKRMTAQETVVLGQLPQPSVIIHLSLARFFSQRFHEHCSKRM